MKAARLGILGVLAVVFCLVLMLSCDSKEDKPTHDQIAGEPDIKANARELKHTIITPHLEQEMAPGTAQS